VKKINSEYLIQVVIPLVVGAFIYFLFRDKILANRILFGLNEAVFPINDQPTFNKSVNSLVFLAIFSLPNALWVFSFTRIYLLLWKNNNSYGLFWFFGAFAVSILFEVAQYFNFIPGTFDWIDLVLVILAGIISLSLSFKELINSYHGKKP
jgi:uncharacterized membrane protein YbhN (UPF0104 family)